MINVVRSVVAAFALSSTEGSAQTDSSNLRPDPLLIRDTAQAPKGGDVLIDVLQNDSHVDPQALQVGRPSCGTTEIVDGKVRYSDTGDCSGIVRFEYSLGTGPDSPFASVEVEIVAAPAAATCGPLAGELGLIRIPAINRKLSDLPKSMKEVTAILGEVWGG